MNVQQLASVQSHSTTSLLMSEIFRPLRDVICDSFGGPVFWHREYNAQGLFPQK